MRWLVGITSAMDMNLGKLQNKVRDREAWCAAAPGSGCRLLAKGWMESPLLRGAALTWGSAGCGAAEPTYPCLVGAAWRGPKGAPLLGAPVVQPGV